jgi:hypothetical protein
MGSRLVRVGLRCPSEDKRALKIQDEFCPDMFDAPVPLGPEAIKPQTVSIGVNLSDQPGP